MTAIRGQPLVKDQIFFRPSLTAGITDHTLLSNIGVNTHPQIDTHIANVGIHVTAGTSTNNTLRWNGAAWVETSNVTIDPVGAVDLEFNSVLALRTTLSGISVHPSTGVDDAIIQMIDNSGEIFRIEKSNVFSVGVLFNEEDGFGIVLQANNISSTPVNMLAADPDTSVDLFFNGIKAFATDVDGASVFDTSGIDPVIFFFEDDLTTRTGFIQLGAGGNNMHIRSEVHGQSFNIEAEDTGGVVVQLLNADPDGSVDLFFDATRTFSTIAEGIAVFDISGEDPNIQLRTQAGVSQASLFIFDGNLTLFNQVDSGTVRLRATNSSSVSTILLDGNPDGGVLLKHLGTNAFSTIAEGIAVFDTAAAQPVVSLRNNGGVVIGEMGFGNANTSLVIDNLNDGAIFALRGNNAGSVLRNFLVGDPDDSVDLYFDGNIAVVTHVSGLSMYESAGLGGATSLRFFNQAGVTQFGNIQMNNSTFGTVIFTITDDEDFTVLGDSVLQGTQNPMIIANPNTGEGVELYSEGTLELDVVPGGVRIVNDLEIDGDLNHDGTNIGFYGTAPAAQSAAYTRNATIVEDRTLLQSSAATALNNNNVLAALIADLQAIGLIG